MQPDSSQKSFCEALDKSIRLLAPAGCGKTLSLLFRCLYLAEKAQGNKPRFLVITFTVSAKEELTSRLNEDIRFKSIRNCIEVTTLNSWGFRRIKNTTRSPKLISSKDEYHFTMMNLLQPIWKNHEHVAKAIDQKKSIIARKLMDQIDSFKSIGFDHKRQNKYPLFVERLNSLRSQGLASKIDEILDELVKFSILPSVTSQGGEEKSTKSSKNIYDMFFRFWREATEHLINSATFTLEDQKYFAYLDEQEKLEEGKYLSGAARYDYILVDEFQDINPLDLSLLKAIRERNRSTITIIGDDDQAIFEWRGATPEYILNPEKYFGVEFLTFTLSTNYRSPKNIVNLSQNLINNNVRRVAKSIHPHRNDDANIEVLQTRNLDESMQKVYEEIENYINEEQGLKRVVIMGRKRSQIIPYQIFFASKNIPFCAAEDLQVFMSQAFDRLLHLIDIKSQSNNKQRKGKIIDDLLELCNLVKRYPLAKKEKESLRRYLDQSGSKTLSNAVDALSEYRGPLKGSNPNGKMSIDMAEAIQSFLDTETVSESLTEMGVHFQGLQADFGKAEDDIFYTDPPFLYLADYAIRYEDDYDQFLEDIENAKEKLVKVPPFEEDNQGESWDDLRKRPIHLMTALRAKGKEFDSVILLDVNDGIWPNKNAQTPEQKESERRLFYVAFTRAKMRVLMLVSSRIGDKYAPPSPFISELGLDFKDDVQLFDEALLNFSVK